MAINSGVPNQSGLSTQYIYTGVASGTPGPASSQGAGNIKVLTPGQASTGQQTAPSTETIAAAGITIPVQQLLGDLHEGEAQAQTLAIYAEVSAGAPTAGQAPTPAPTVKVASSAASTGQQPAVTTPFTQSGWGTKSVV